MVVHQGSYFLKWNWVNIMIYCNCIYLIISWYTEIYIYIYNCKVSWCLSFIIWHPLLDDWFFKMVQFHHHISWCLFDGKLGSHNPPGKLSVFWAPYQLTSEDQKQRMSNPTINPEACNSKKTDPKPKYVFAHVIVSVCQPFH